VSGIETIVRDRLCRTLEKPPAEADSLDLERALGDGYGLGSLDLVMLMTEVCAAVGVPLTALDENDIAGLRTPADIVGLLSAKAAA